MVEAGLLSFRQPEWLWLLVAAPVALLFLIGRERRRRSLADRFVSESLRSGSRLVRSMRPFGLAIALGLGVLGLAGPRWGHETAEVRGNSANRVILLDASNSMLAEDVGTSRLTAAKAIARRIIESHEGRIGMVVFEGTAQIVSPLTTDRDAVLTLLDSIEAGESGEPGSNLSAAIREGLRLVDVRSGEATDFVLISDGEERGGDGEEAAQEAAARKIAIRTVTIGTAAGAAISLHDEKGNPVITRADASVLAEIARASGGRAYVNPFGADAARDLSSGYARGRTAAPEKVSIPIERFQWPLGTALALFFLASLAHRGAE